MNQDTLRVLLLDDEDSVREPLADHLRRDYHYHVDSAGNGMEAMRLIEEAQGRYDVGLIDALLEDGPDGLEILRQIKSKYPDIEVILFTGWGMKSALDALQAGAYRYFAKPFNLEELALTIRFAAEQGQARRERKLLSELQQVSAAISSTLELDEILRRTCQAAVQLLGVDHSGLVRFGVTSHGFRFSPDYQEGRVIAEYPRSITLQGLGTLNQIIPLKGVPAEERLIFKKEILNIPEVADDESLGPVRDILLEYGICSILLVPIVVRDKVVASFSADAIHQRRTFSLAEIEVCKHLANQAAVAIENARLLQEAQEQAAQLTALRQTALAVTSQLDRKALLATLIQQAVRLLQARSGGVYEYHPERGELAIIADFGRPGNILGTTLKVGEGIAGRLVNSSASFMIVDDYNQWEGQAPIYAGQRLFGAVIEVPLKWGEGVIGVLYVDDVVGRKFTEEDAKLLTLFADHAAIALVNADLVAKDAEKVRLLEALDEASRHIRAEREIPKLLHEIVRMTAELVGCREGGLFINRAGLEELEMVVAYKLPAEMIGSRVPHSVGLIGTVARTGETILQDNYSNWSDREAIFEPCQFKTVIGVPLKHAGEVEAVLFVADSTVQHQFTRTDREILERFALQASIALQTSRMVSVEQRAFERQAILLAILYKISNYNYIGAADNLTKVLHIILTGITAGYGLSFNRAALFLFDEARENLVGRMGIGYLDEVEAKANWQEHQQRGLEDFRRYLELLEQGSLALTPIGERIPNLQLVVSSDSADIFSQVIRDKHWTIITQNALLDKLPRQFSEAFRPAVPSVVVALVVQQQAIGILVADNKFTKSPITSEDVKALLTFANTAAVAIENSRLFETTKQASQRLRSLYMASNTLVSSEDPERILRHIVEQAFRTAEASGTTMILMDREAHIRQIIAAGIDEGQIDPDLVRPNGLSMQVMHTGVPEIIADTSAQWDRVNPTVLKRGIAAALGLPVSVEGKRIGVMWIHYDKTRHFSQADIQDTQFYVNQAAIAYDSARRIKELEYMRRAAEALASAGGLQEVLRQTVTSAREVLQADSAVIWSYDAVHDNFILEQSVADGIPDALWEKFKKVGPQPGGTAHTVMEGKWIGVEDVADLQRYEFVGEFTRNLLGQIGAQSFQGVALMAEGERLGVLYVDYNRLRAFSEEEQEIARTFANHAALAIRKAKLMDQVNKSKQAAEAVAHVVTLGDRQATLQSIVQRTMETVGCNALTLYVYDQATNKMQHPPTMEGVKFPERAKRYEKVLPDSIVSRVLEHDKPYIVEVISEDPLFRYSRFSRDEGIESCVAIPLKVARQKVGVLFVNYRSRHHFTADELSNITLFANQAAVAIHNAQLYSQVQKQVGTLHTLYEANRVVASSLDLDEIFNHLAEQAWGLGGQRGFTTIKRVEGHKAKWVAAYPRQELDRLRTALGEEIEWNTGIDGRIGITGRAIKTGKTQLVNDVAQDPDYLETHPDTRSELVAPIVRGDRVIGVINIEHSELNAFSKEDEQILELLAAQAAVAIQNARQYGKTRDALEARTALAWTGMMSSTWRHAIEKHAVTVREQVQHLREALAKGAALGSINERLGTIERLANKILEKPITPPLSAEEGVASVPLNELIRGRTKQLWAHEPYQSVELSLELSLADAVNIRLSPEWFRRAFDILVDNAVEATADQPDRKLTVSTRPAKDAVEIWIVDNGKGIPDEILLKLFREPIKKSAEAKGLGMGLLFAQTIVETYGGNIRLGSSSSVGTTMIIWLPLPESGVPRG